VRSVRVVTKGATVAGAIQRRGEMKGGCTKGRRA
jgi:hypothetical protein